MLGIFVQLDKISTERLSLNLTRALDQRNLGEVVSLLKQLFVRVPYQLHAKEEKFYHALLQVAFGAAGINAQSEFSISHGRIDLVLDLPTLLYVIEVKFNKPVEIALAQIEERKYYEAFMDRGKPIELVGLSFKREPKNFEITYASKSLSKS